MRAAARRQTALWQILGRFGAFRQLRKEKLLPALATPTVSTLADPQWVDLSTVVEEKRGRELIPQLYAAGARGINELPLNKIVE